VMSCSTSTSCVGGASPRIAQVATGRSSEVKPLGVSREVAREAGLEGGDRPVAWGEAGRELSA
jgi:hypothetical protein